MALGGGTQTHSHCANLAHVRNTVSTSVTRGWYSITHHISILQQEQRSMDYTLIDQAFLPWLSRSRTKCPLSTTHIYALSFNWSCPVSSLGARRYKQLLALYFLVVMYTAFWHVNHLILPISITCFLPRTGKQEYPYSLLKTENRDIQIYIYSSYI